MTPYSLTHPKRPSALFWNDEDEMHAVTAVIRAIDHILKTYGTELTDEQYINAPEWTQVVSAAQTALAVLNKKPVNSP